MILKIVMHPADLFEELVIAEGKVKEAVESVLELEEILER